MAACSSVVFSSTTASGFRLGGLFGAEAGPRSIIFREISEEVATRRELKCEIRTSPSLLAAKATAASQYDGTLVGENDFASDFVNGLDRARHVGCFALSRVTSVP